MATVKLKNKGAEWSDVQASPIKGDRTRPVAQNPFWNLSVLWPDAHTSPIGDDRTRPVNEVPLWKWTGRTIDASDQFSSHVRSRHWPSLTLVNMIYMSLLIFFILTSNSFELSLQTSWNTWPLRIYHEERMSKCILNSHPQSQDNKDFHPTSCKL
jgi:hypothetical protein